MMDSTATGGLKRWRAVMVLVTCFLVGFGGAAPIAANAGVSWSLVGNFTHPSSKKFRNQAVVYTTTNQAFAATATASNGHSIVPGWMGSRGRLYRATTDALSCEGQNTYNPTTYTSGQWIMGVSCTRTGSSTWYSYGVSRAYNGTTWKNVFTFKSGIQNS